MQIENIKIDKLIPYARNARTHTDEQVAQIAASIKEFGFTSPILIRDDLTIIAGHGRLKGALKLGLTEVPCIRLKNLTLTQSKAYGIVDNQLTLNSEWELELLILEVQELKLEDFNLDILGMDLENFGIFSADEVSVPDLPNGEKAPFRQITFTVHDEQFEEVEDAIKKAKELGGGESAVNENSNGNALAFICGRFVRGQS